MHVPSPQLPSVASEPRDVLSPRLPVIALMDAQVAPASFAPGALECHPQPMRCRVKHITNHLCKPWGFLGQWMNKEEPSRSLFLLTKHLLTPLGTEALGE